MNKNLIKKKNIKCSFIYYSLSFMNTLFLKSDYEFYFKKVFFLLKEDQELKS